MVFVVCFVIFGYYFALLGLAVFVCLLTLWWFVCWVLAVLSLVLLGDCLTNCVLAGGLGLMITCFICVWILFWMLLKQVICVVSSVRFFVGFGWWFVLT